MYVFAYICLLIALLSSLGGSSLALIQIYEGQDNHLALVRRANWLVTVCLLLASALLLHALFWQDYRLEYVASYTDSLLPLFYRLTAFWAGQPGSMLFWALITACCGALFALAPSHSSENSQTSLWFWCLFHAVMSFFCLILTSWSNPFIMQEPTPSDGQGLNPLLQNPGMIFHPPLLFMGYAGFTVPACLALAQLIAPSLQPWFRVTRPFWLISWLLLTAGIALGAWWAYMELGWGGYWAWDPVENASLLPWLLGTAAIHIIVLDNRLGKLNRAATCLISLTLISAFFATYLTRSGIIQSVHAFGDGGVGTPLTIFVLAASFIAFYICCLSPVKGADLAHPLSREGALVLVAWLLLALAAIIAVATLWPVISKLWGVAAQGLDASFYNRVCLPLGAALLLLLCVCLWLGWSGGLKDPARSYATAGAFIAACIAIWLAGYRQPLALICAAAAIAAICAMLLILTEKSAWANKQTLAATCAHLGLAILALGISFSGPYKTERDLLLSKGQTENIGSYSVSLEDAREGSGPGYDYLRATLKISSERVQIGILRPERRIYAKFGDMQFSEVDVINGLGRDIYASLLGMDEDHRVLVRIALEPLVNWIWIGAAMLCVLPLIGLGRSRRRMDYAA